MFEQTFKNIDDLLYKDSGSDRELDVDKLSPLLLLKYNALADAKREFGAIQTIRDTFIGFQEYLYRDRA